jgi:transcriptional regulator NrdR family protein
MLKSFAVKQAKGFKPFIRDKLFITINDSLKHRKSHIDDATALTDTVISQLGEANQSNGVLTRSNIAQITTITLRRFDKTAATVYSALHSNN